MMTAPDLRPLRREDLDGISGIESRIAGHPRKGFLAKRFAAAESAPEGFITCVADDGGKPAGYGFARIQEGEFGARGTVAMLDIIGVDPDAQRKGIGKAVIAEIERRMRERRIESLRTQVAWAVQGMIRFFASAGFRLAPAWIVERDTSQLKDEESEAGGGEFDVKRKVRGGAQSGDYGPLARDRVLVRSLKEEDLASVVRIDRKLTGLDRSAYYAAKCREMLGESGIRISLASEDAGVVTGFIMARVDFGEFGKVDRSAAIDTIGVHPAYGGSGIGHALLSQLLLNLSTLMVESVLVQVSWENFGLQRFLHARGFAPSQRLVLEKVVG